MASQDLDMCLNASERALAERQLSSRSQGTPTAPKGQETPHRSKGAGKDPRGTEEKVSLRETKGGSRAGGASFGRLGRL